jgi:hypothetical protein
MSQGSNVARRRQYFEHGLAVLAESGFRGLTVGVLGTRLGVLTAGASARRSPRLRR